VHDIRDFSVSNRSIVSALQRAVTACSKVYHVSTAARFARIRNRDAQTFTVVNTRQYVYSWRAKKFMEISKFKYPTKISTASCENDGWNIHAASRTSVQGKAICMPRDAKVVKLVHKCTWFMRRKEKSIRFSISTTLDLIVSIVRNRLSISVYCTLIAVVKFVNVIIIDTAKIMQIWHINFEGNDKYLYNNIRYIYCLTFKNIFNNKTTCLIKLNYSCNINIS